jgi:hypothetical protein
MFEFGFQCLFPDPINPNAALAAPAVFNPHAPHLKPPAFDDDLTAAGAKRVFRGITGHVAGIDVF